MKMGAAAPIINQVEMDAQENFTPAQIQRFKDDPAFYDLFTRTLDLDSNLKFALSLVEGSPQQRWAAQKCREYMMAMLGGDPALCAALIPEFPIGCRRLTPAPGYLEAVRDPKVEVVTVGISRFVRGGIELASGEVLEVDAVICATGFDRSFRPPFPIHGRKGNLQDVLRVEPPTSYMSVGIAGMPNYFSESLSRGLKRNGTGGRWGVSVVVRREVLLTAAPRVPRPARADCARRHLQAQRGHRVVHRARHP